MTYNHFVRAAKVAVGAGYAAYYAQKGAQYIAKHKHYVVPPAAAYYYRNRKRMPPTTRSKKRASSHVSSHRSSSHAGHGTSSTGDMNKVVFKAKHVSGGAYKRKVAFKKKIENALEGDLPLIKTVKNVTMSMTAAGNLMQYNIIAMSDVSDMTSLNDNIVKQTTGLASSKSESFVQRDYRIDGFYTNAANTLCIMDWYLVIPRTNLVEDPNNSFGAGNNLIASGGETDSATVGAGGNNIGITPF